MKKNIAETSLLRLIKNRSAQVGVVGVGYVGSALGLGATKGGFTVTGFARTQQSVDRVSALKQRKFTATNDFSQLAKCHIICVCVPTPLGPRDTTDLSMFKAAIRTISKYMHPGQLIIIESSIVPGTTRTIAFPILLESNLTLEKDFFLGFSPERIDPGNKKFSIHNTPKIVSGMGPSSRKLIHAFYATFVGKIIDVSSPETAELAKFFENTFRFVNIGLASEFAQYARLLKINVWEMIDAAATKPFGFMPHYPGPGIGGDCIPVLPRHLLTSAKKNHVSLPIVSAAVSTDRDVPKLVINSALKLLNGKRKEKLSPKILLVGISYKANVGDLRESPALKIWELLEKKGITVTYHDPYVPTHNGAKSTILTKHSIQEHDAIVITTPHRNIPYKDLVSAGIPILDTRNALAAYAMDHIVRL